MCSLFEVGVSHPVCTVTVMKPVADPRLAQALKRARAAAIELGEAIDEADITHRDVRSVMKQMESVSRITDACDAAVLNVVDERGLYARDGHTSAKVMARHINQLSNADASRRASMVRALRRLPRVKAAFDSGRIGVSQVSRIARVYANPRVRERLIDEQATFVTLARHLPYDEFDAKVTYWVQMVDEDGTADTAETHYRNRDVRITKEYDGSYRLSGRFDSVQGARIEEVLDHFNDAEALADIDEAQQRSARTPPSPPTTCADAQANDAPTGSNGASWAAPPTRMPAARPTGSPTWCSTTGRWTASSRSWPESRRACSRSAIRGISASNAAPATVACWIRAWPPSPQSAATSVGCWSTPRASSSTSAAGLACTATTPGSPCSSATCSAHGPLLRSGHQLPDRPSRTVHRTRRRPGWRANQPGNGAPLCGRHNRFKEHGFSVHLDEDGRWHTYRPDGSEI